MSAPRFTQRSAGLSVLGLCFSYLLIRSFIGVDLADGSYVLALARRMAAGDRPFADEMSAHTLGSLPAVPFVWLWTHLFGDSGLIAASRVFAALWISLVLTTCYVALKNYFGPIAAATALGAVGLCLPYSILATSYNTVPMFLLLLATCSAYRVVRAYSRPWAVCASLSATFAAIAFPAVSIGAMLLLLVLIVLLARGAGWCQGVEATGSGCPARRRS